MFVIERPGSSRENRDRLRKFGFATKKEAEVAEAAARMEQQKAECVKNPSSAPGTLDLLMEKFLALHCEGPDPLAGKTVQRYRDHKTYLSSDLLARAPEQITRVDFTAEWKRLLAFGGRTRRDKTPRPLSARTVRHIAATVSSAYNWGGSQGFFSQNLNPVKFSERPRVRKREAVALAPEHAELVLSVGTGFWCRPVYLHAADALGCRRGELLAVRWSDWRNGEFRIARSLTQFRDAAGQVRLEFKSTKEDEIHYVTVPSDLAMALEEHRQLQREFETQFGASYQDHDLIFANEDGTPLRPDSVSASVSALCKSLGLPKGTSLHSLRHTHASALLAQGVPLTTVSKRLGHASIRTTADIYSHVIHRAEDQRAARAYEDYRQRRQTQQEAKHADLVQ
jgi:integrase